MDQKREKPTTKRDEIIKIEREIRSKWNTKVVRSDNKNKKFITVPIPYMNGTLHLGHGYTISKAIFISEFYRLKGYNVLFPFGYHGTGMPIVASAAKLKGELAKYHSGNEGGCDYQSLPPYSQMRILLDMNVKKGDLYKFADPYYWIKYFPIEAERDIIDFGARVDFSRSFVTTDVNPHYDSFVKWQFSKLIKDGLVVYGNRYVIYSEKDGQPCADHDRSEGEGVEAKNYKTKLIRYTTSTGKLVNVIATCKELYVDQEIYSVGSVGSAGSVHSADNEVSYNPNEKFVSFEYEGNVYIVREGAYTNIKHQYEGTKYTGYFDLPLEFAIGCTEQTGKYSVPKKNKSVAKRSTGFTVNIPGTELNCKGDFTYYEPEKEVISRSGDLCIVALTPQWFINYGDGKLKEQVNEYITGELFSPDPAVTNHLLSSSKWIKEWPCSRNYGLGTVLPGTNYIIDSLSDSTIYMSYYTVAHLIGLVPVDIINSGQVWDYIFGFNSELSEVAAGYANLINEMREEFNYWYPVDVRVSGKDLVPNHLTMCLYNHIAIWGRGYCPRSYAINGYQKLNGEKMSKHTGNFKTLRDAIDKYGADALRLSLAECDGIDDADFRDEIANGHIMKLSSEREWFTKMVDHLSSNVLAITTPGSYNNIWESILDSEVKMCMKRSHDHYKNYRFRKAVYDGFHSALQNRDMYMKFCAMSRIEVNSMLIYKTMSCILLMIYPVCPHFVEYIWDYGRGKGVGFVRVWNDEEYYISQGEYNYLKYYKDVIDGVVNTISRESARMSKNRGGQEQKKISVTVSIIRDYTEDEREMIEKVVEFYNLHTEVERSDKLTWKAFISEYTKSCTGTKQKSESGKFMSYIKLNLDTYGTVWLKCIKEVGTQSSTIREWVPKLLNINSSGSPKDFGVPIFTGCSNIKGIEFIDEGASISYKLKNGPGRPQISFSYE
jgi:leucyl-tRNA synthetase